MAIDSASSASIHVGTDVFIVFAASNQKFMIHTFIVMVVEVVIAEIDGDGGSDHKGDVIDTQYFLNEIKNQILFK